MARPIELGGKTSRFLLLASICVIIAGLYFGREVLIPLALAILLTFLLAPPVRWIEKLHAPRTLATLVVVTITVGIIAAIGFVSYRQFRSIVNELPTIEAQLRTKLHAVGAGGGIFGRFQRELQTVNISSAPSVGAPASATSTTQPVPVMVVPRPPTTVEIVRDYAGKFLYPLATAGLVLIFVFFMLVNREDLRDRMIRLIGHGKIHLTTQAVNEAGSRITRYLTALAVVNASYAVVTAGGLWVIGHFFGGGSGFPNVLVWGILVGLFRFVPYVGIWIGASSPLLLSFALFPGYGAFAATLGLFIVLEIVVSQFIEPIWYGASTGMSALAVLVAAVFWTWLWGGIGLLLSTPMTVCLVVIGKYVPQLRFLDILLGDEPVLPPHVRVYQRLIASDEEEAGDLAQELLKEQSLERVYDEVLLPAVILSSNDHRAGRLEDERHAYVLQAVRDLVEELSEERATELADQENQRAERAGKDQSPLSPAAAMRPGLPKDCTVNVLCLPAKDEADEIVALMLTHLLSLRGYCATGGSSDSLASEMLDQIEQRHAQIVCVSALPPAAIAHARYLCKRIHARFEELEMTVGLWHTKVDAQRAKRRIACADAVRVVGTLAAAQHEIDQLAQSFILHSSAPAPAAVS